MNHFIIGLSVFKVYFFKKQTLQHSLHRDSVQLVCLNNKD